MTIPPTFPHAFDTVQRAPEGPILYRRAQQWSDSWAGWRDRRAVKADDAGAAQSPWLQRLEHECATSLEAERRSTQAIFAVLDAGIVEARESIATANAHVEELHARRGQMKAAELSSAPVTAVDHTDAGDSRLARRHREQGLRLGELDSAQKQWESTIDAARQAIQSLVAARAWHWSLLLTRCAHLLAFFSRRAATYTRAASRKSSDISFAPEVRRPLWLDAAEAPAIVEPQTF